MSETRDCSGEAAAYVLGALDERDAEEFRRHLVNCVMCRDEVSAFQQVVDALPMAAPQQPLPKALRRRVMSAVRAEPRGVARAPRRPFLSAVSWPRPALGAAVALAAVAALVIGLSVGGGGGTRLIQASVNGVPGSAQLRVSGRHAELIVRGLSQPPAGHVYEVWLVRGKQAPTPTNALFSVTSSGAGNVDVPGNLRGVSEVLVSPEPAGGSAAPTHAPVIAARLD